MAKENISFRVSPVEFIAIETHARKAEMSRSEFCRMAINYYINRSQVENKKEAEEKARREEESSKILSALFQLNDNVVTLKEIVSESHHDANERLTNVMLGGFRTLAKGVVATNPESAEVLKRIFRDPRVWK